MPGACSTSRLFRCFRTVAICSVVWGSATAQQAHETPFKLSVSVQEVSLTFSAFTAQGQGIDSITKADLLLEDDRTPQKIDSLTYFRDLPIHAGFLFDTSISMIPDLRHNAAIAQLYAAHILQRGKDQVFVAGFDTQLTVTQDWTDNPAAIDSGIQKLSSISENGASATDLFDSLYKSCRDRWPATKGPVTGNFNMLFTDGIDNASHAELSDAVNICQRSRTAIYIFTNQWNARGSSQGAKTLASLVAQSGLPALCSIDTGFLHRLNHIRLDGHGAGHKPHPKLVSNCLHRKFILLGRKRERQVVVARQSGLIYHHSVGAAIRSYLSNGIDDPHRMPGALVSTAQNRS